ncbi:hypothetical protein C8D94_105119 [Marinirhabdus gelatinilytica]|uniref:UbiA prenyltransferase family protein n=1 Tax=Marinirhabdus gelatinilytica TaxID=1703343 RepID=A0A370Q7E5_9FLAO|nr:hypothetical protein C8D94_105119 [Marinirhabdus gelatinilytica]
MAVVSFALITTIEFDLNVPIAFWVFIFCGTVTGYNFVKYAKIAGLHHRSLANSLRSIQIFSFLCFAALLLSCFFLQMDTLIVTGIFGFFTVFYAVPFLKRKNLRTFSGIKILIVALVWAGVTVFVPMVAAGMTFTTDCWLAFLQRFFLVFVLTLPFEIRDLQYDVAQLKTIPQLLGVKKAKLLGMGLLVGVLLLEGFKDTIVPSSFYSLFCMVGITGIALLAAQKEQSRYYSSFWVEGIPIAGLLLLLLFGHFLA